LGGDLQLLSRIENKREARELYKCCSAESRCLKLQSKKNIYFNDDQQRYIEYKLNTLIIFKNFCQHFPSYLPFCLLFSHISWSFQGLNKIISFSLKRKWTLTVSCRWNKGSGFHFFSLRKEKRLPTPKCFDFLSSLQLYRARWEKPRTKGRQAKNNRMNVEVL
jgi:hypothetical protein